MRMRALAPLLLLTCSLPALAEEVELVTGEKLRGTLVERTDAQVVLDHPVLGRLFIPAYQLKAAAPATAAPGKPAAPGESAATPAAPAPPAPPPWKFRAELGASGSSGNTDQSDLHAAIGAVYEDEKRKFKASAGWLKSETDDEKTKDQQYVEATHDWLFKDSPWSVFVTGRMDWDEFQDWDRRATVGGGAGYLLVKSETLEMRLRAGLVGTREWGSTDEDREDWRPEGLFGGELTWKATETSTVEAKSTWYPDFDDTGERRIVSSASWAVKLAKDSGLSLKVGVEHEYDSHNEDPFDTEDVRYFAALLWEF